MSALAGVWRFDGSPGANLDCARMLAALSPFGPSPAAQWDGATISVGRRLFRTLPEDRLDTGPTPTPDGGRMVADVRLDNREDLVASLGIDPARARSLADSAILAAAWTRWGEELFDHLVGDYAFALWDANSRRLVLARDPFGHRPLHLHRARGWVAFASMPVGLHALPGTTPTPDLARLADFLALKPEQGAGAFFEGIERVEPGSMLVIDAAGAKARRHYAPSPRTLRLSGPDDYAQALRERLDQAVRSQLRGAEGGVGAHLSSGWDSAAVAVTAARLLGPIGGRVTAFTAAPRAGYAGAPPPGRHGDESPGAAEVAALHDNIDHVILRNSARSPLQDLDRDIAFAGRPPLNPCNHAWINDINRAARARGIAVMLTGDFGNLGLTADGLDALPDLAAQGRWPPWWALARAVRRAGALRWPGIVAASLEGDPPTALWRALRRLGGQSGRLGDHSALRPELWPAAAPPARTSRRGRAERIVATLTGLDPAPHAKAALAAFGVDVRDPLTDRRLIEFCLSVPVEQLIADGRTRALARRALADRLPASVLERRTRGYQAADWHEGLTADRATAARDVERLAALPAAAGLLDIERMRRLIAAWPTGGWERDEVIDAYRLALSRGLAVGRFLTHTLRPNA